MIIKKMLLTVLLGITFSGTQAQDKFLDNSNETKEVSKKVSELFKENKIIEAFTILRTYWPLPENEIDEMQGKTIKSLNTVGERFGKSEGIIKVNDEAIKDFAIRETYLVKYQNIAIRLIFVYYKNEKGWIINSFKWDDNFDQEFK